MGSVSPLKDGTEINIGLGTMTKSTEKKKMPTTRKRDHVRLDFTGMIDEMLQFL